MFRIRILFRLSIVMKRPQTLGIDRMVHAAGATLQFPNQNRLVIDAGTCVTYDFIDESNNYLGGAISPGLQLRYAALHNFTAKLPLLDFGKSATFYWEIYFRIHSFGCRKWIGL